MPRPARSAAGDGGQHHDLVTVGDLGVEATEAYPSRTDIGLASEPGAHYVLVSTREHGNNEGPVEFRSYRIVNGEVTEEDVEVVPELPPAEPR